MLLIPLALRGVLDRVEGRELGVIGEPRLNVLLLNLAIDRQFGQPTREGQPSEPTGVTY